MEEPRPDDRATSDRVVERHESDDGTTYSSEVGHLYRGTVDRTTTWRTRLDQTTRWAVVVMVAVLTWAFSNPDNPHYVVLVGMAAVAAFLLVEAHRYREYDVWRKRVRLVERNVYADAFDAGGPANVDWRRRLGEDLRNPSISLSYWVALLHRLRRIYFLLLSILFAAWVLRISVFDPNLPWWETAAIGAIPGFVVGLVVGGIYVLFGVSTLASFRGRTKREFESPESE